jgi:structural maintenance of chromosome 2
MIRIEEIIIDGFKSYGTKTIFSAFDEHFSSITGKNGSGKSNFLDAICFVLGLSNLNFMRVLKINDLIFQDTTIKNKYALVTIVFKKKNLINPRNFERKIEKIIITRKIILGGRNMYFLNNKNAKPGQIIDLLYSINVNINNPHFFIRQGHITKISQMKSKELFEILINAFGIKFYELKKKIALEIIIKKNEKIMKIEKMLKSEIQPHLNLIAKSSFYLNKFEIFKRFNFKRKKSFFVFNKNLKKYFVKNYIFKKKKGLFKSFFFWKSISVIFFRTFILIYKNFFFFFEKMKIFNFIFDLKIYKKLKKASQTSDFLIFLGYKKKNSLMKNYFKNICFFKKKKIRCEINFLKNFKKKKKKNESKTFYKKRVMFLKQILFKKNFYLYLFNTTTYFFFFHFFLLKIIKDFFSIKIVFNFFSIDFFFLKEYFFKKKFLMSIKYDQQNKKKKIMKNTNIKKTIQKSFFWKKLIFKIILFLEPLNSKNKINLWSIREVIDGTIGSLIQIKNSYCTTAIELLSCNQLSFILIQNEMFSKKILELINLLKKVTIIPLNKFLAGDNELKFKTLLTGIQKYLFFKKKYEKIINFIFGSTKLAFSNAEAEKIIFSSKVEKKCITIQGDIFSSSGLMVIGKEIEFGHCFLAILSELNLVKSSICRIGFLYYNFKKKNFNCNEKIFDINFLKKKKKIGLNFLEKKFEKMYLNIYFFINLLNFKFNKNFLKILKNKSFLQKRVFNIFLRKKSAKKKSFNHNKKFFKHKIYYYEKSKLFLRKIEMLENKINREKKFFFKKNLFILSKKKIKKDFFIKKKFFFFIKIINILFIFVIRKINNLKIFKFQNQNKFFWDFFFQKYPILKKIKKIHNKIYKKKTIFFRFLKLKKFKNFYHLITKTKNLLNLFQKDKMIFLKRKNFFFILEGLREYKEFIQKRVLIEKDRFMIQEIINILDFKKNKIISQILRKINCAFQLIFSTFFPDLIAKLVTIRNKQRILLGIKFKIFFHHRKSKKTISEFSGGQKSILALSFIFSLLISKPVPFYILDEIDAALDLTHTHNIGKMIIKYFPMSQFIIVSLKNGIILSAKIIFKIKIDHGKSLIIRLDNKNNNYI